MSLPADLERAHAPKDVDVSAAGRGVWLVKVPKYLSEQWKTFASGTDVGKLKISKSKIPNKKPDIVFTTFNSQRAQQKPGVSAAVTTSSSQSIASSSVSAGQQFVALGQLSKPAMATSQDHKFLVTNVGAQKLVVMSQAKPDKSAPANDITSDKICIEGKVMQRAECHPIVDANYRQLKRAQVYQQNQPQRQMKLLPSVGQTYKPVKNHARIMEEKKAKKADKRSRAEKDKVMDILFSAFEKHQFYTIKNLVNITRQPVPYLKEILKEICNYNMAAPHKNMWELKPEFRHYKNQEEEDGADAT